MDAFEKLFREMLREAVDENIAMARVGWEHEFRCWNVAEVYERTGLSVTALRELRDNPRKNFPKPVGFNTKPCWIASEVMEWARANRMDR